MNDSLIQAANKIKKESYQYWIRNRDDLLSEEREELGKKLTELHQLLSEFLIFISCEK